jgi:hypothetical protein
MLRTQRASACAAQDSRTIPTATMCAYAARARTRACTCPRLHAQSPPPRAGASPRRRIALTRRSGTHYLPRLPCPALALRAFRSFLSLFSRDPGTEAGSIEPGQWAEHALSHPAPPRRSSASQKRIAGRARLETRATRMFFHRKELITLGDVGWRPRRALRAASPRAFGGATVETVRRAQYWVRDPSRVDTPSIRDMLRDTPWSSATSRWWVLIGRTRHPGDRGVQRRSSPFTRGRAALPRLQGSARSAK